MANWDVEVLSMILLGQYPDVLLVPLSTFNSPDARLLRRLICESQSLRRLIFHRSLRNSFLESWDGFQFLIFLGHRSR